MPTSILKQNTETKAKTNRGDFFPLPATPKTENFLASPSRRQNGSSNP
jgi:hypothetical protein